MRLTLAERELAGAWTPRPLEPSEVSELGALLLAAYRGTVDDEGETESDAMGEVERTMEGEYGRFLPECSFAVHDGGRIVGASMVALSEPYPLLAYVVVHPDAKRRGVGSLLVAATGNALLATGHAELELFVTEANEPAVNLYRKLGFRLVDRLPAPPA